MNYDDNYEDEAFQTLRHFALVGLRNLNIQNRLIISYIISTIFPLLFVYLYSYYLYGSSVVTGQLLVLSILIAGIALTMTTYTYLSISSPIQHMIETCQNISDGNLDVRIQDKGNDELAYLSDNIDSMVTEIQLLLEQRQESDARKRELELKMLQYQINPHFLYNTLDSIIWMAEGKKNEEVVIMTASLARLLRQSISNEDELVTVGQEIEYVRSYLTIQKMRYKDKLEFEIKADPSITQVPIIRLVLQPIVENAIYHGLKYKDSKGLLTVHGYMKGENAVIDITDDGVGMDEETLKHIYDKHKVNYRSNGVGVYNVQQRLVLYYGKDYGIIYHSEKGKGTTASVVIPGIQEESHEKS